MDFFMLRQAYSHEEATHLGGARTLSLLNLPSITSLLHIARLRHLLCCARARVDVFWGMPHLQLDWLVAARGSLEWLWGHVDGCRSFPCWRRAWDKSAVCLDSLTTLANGRASSDRPKSRLSGKRLGKLLWSADSSVVQGLLCLTPSLETCPWHTSVRHVPSYSALIRLVCPCS